MMVSMDIYVKEIPQLLDSGLETLRFGCWCIAFACIGTSAWGRSAGRYDYNGA